ncbi:hypothetical protein [Paraburkholderia sp. J41]|uniref:hypothetical protein n=1 Tax=Paraburkholderia sp. J41 TaxID=2805433 RepID=UPI002AC343FB|nr:hypothetical protein [Paraburkholderia sp. J41]
MKSFIERQLYQPALVLPMVDLMQLMVSFDFNMGQVGLMMATRGARAAFTRSRELWNAGPGECVPARGVHDCVH